MSLSRADISKPQFQLTEPASSDKVSKEIKTSGHTDLMRLVIRIIQVFGILLLLFFLLALYFDHWGVKKEDFWVTDKMLAITFITGFLAQLVDGAMGMGFGLTSSTVLLSTGINPAIMSGSIHTAEMFSSAASGYSHYRIGNVNKKLLRALIIPGVLGAVAGAFLITKLGSTNMVWVRPFLACYTMLLGIRLLIKAFVQSKPLKKFRRYGWLAGFGGFMDAFSGGGWGPIVTSTLISKGKTPRMVIGTVSLTEFFVTFSSSLTFFLMLGMRHSVTILGLVLGGVLAAPLSAKLAGKIPPRACYIGLGMLVITWSLKIIYNIWA